MVVIPFNYGPGPVVSVCEMIISILFACMCAGNKCCRENA